MKTHWNGFAILHQGTEKLEEPNPPIGRPMLFRAKYQAEDGAKALNHVRKVDGQCVSVPVEIIGSDDYELNGPLVE